MIWLLAIPLWILALVATGDCIRDVSKVIRMPLRERYPDLPEE
jgi:hypothetical protein